MKTVHEHLDENLPAFVLKEALENTPPDNLKVSADDPATALSAAFKWKNTTQGYDYWDAIQNVLFEKHRLVKKLEQTETKLDAAELKIEELERQAEEAEELGDALHGEQIGILNTQALNKKLLFEKIAARWGDLTILDMERIEKILDEKGTYF